ncbi:MAG: thioredoxin domain-containing protein [Vulcanimicrobiaceae bacterium]
MSHRFSPRANRAAEIGWMEWGTDAFARAKETNRPILLGISAVWCHWCHVMDETTYSDQRVIDLISERYVPVRVDNDQRPDVNARYNMGGWPTTAILSPSGEILTGATYIPPDDFVHVLEHVAQAWTNDRDNLEARMPEQKHTHAPVRGKIDPGAPAAIASAIAGGYDEKFAGFGTAPKFPQADALRYLLLLYRRDRTNGKADQRLYDMLARTALAMARGGMYDHVEGGFFRYSTTRDWSIPHFEKMGEDHGGLLRFYADLYRVSGNPQFAQTLRSVLRWLRGVLRNPGSPLFGGSQDADEEYFALDLESRGKREAPYVDRTVYTNWNAELAHALIAASIALDDDTLLADARATVDALVRDMLAPSGVAMHFRPPNGAPQIDVLLTDQVALADVLLSLHATTGIVDYLDRARALADATIARFRGDNGSFVDSDDANALGNVKIPLAPLDENATFADVLLRLGAILHEERYMHVARGILEAFDGKWQRAGSFAAIYGAAVLRLLEDPLTITITGTQDSTSVLRDAALRLPDPLAVVHSTPSGDAPLATICSGTRCAAPATNAATLQESWEALRQLPVR